MSFNIDDRCQIVFKHNKYYKLQRNFLVLSLIFSFYFLIKTQPLKTLKTTTIKTSPSLHSYDFKL